MQQAFGHIRASNSTVKSGSGNFSVTKDGTGSFQLYFQNSGGTEPTVLLSPMSAYTTANVVLQNWWTDGTNARLHILTGFTDQRSAMDCDFSFQVIWP
ncbi:hypothetical protein BO221_36425 [Archangium sp. Cb G35]|uniref:hypothetical protein n=1 Tax=Archangium sp. Cb G35 TaxID=1920190 RepID=UPI000935F03B|nr:hypothetical protein [Archangium sp. Cb G35]OJT19009.1 hypothetical protein BO221_36425 [Archangium sp. Cb G35]